MPHYIKNVVAIKWSARIIINWLNYVCICMRIVHAVIVDMKWRNSFYRKTKFVMYLHRHEWKFKWIRDVYIYTHEYKHIWYPIWFRFGVCTFAFDIVTSLSISISFSFSICIFVCLCKCCCTGDFFSHLFISFCFISSWIPWMVMMVYDCVCMLHFCIII